MSSSVVTVEELTGRRRKIELVGSGLPRVGAGWDNDTAMKTAFNAGNPEATQHVLTSKVEPSEWNGVWRTTMLVRTPCRVTAEDGMPRDVVVASTLVDAFEAINVGGQLLRVTWTNDYPAQGSATGSTRHEWRIVRVGRLRKFGWKPARLHDVEWTMTFEWLGRGRVRPSDTDLLGNTLLSSVAKTVGDFDGAATSVERAAPAGPNFNLSRIQAMFDAPKRLVDDFARAARGATSNLRALGQILVTAKELPASLLSSVVDLATNTLAIANQFLDAMGREGPETMAVGSKVGNMMMAASYYADATTQAEFMAAAAMDLARAARTRKSSMEVDGSSALASDILAVHLPRDGDTFSSISVRYYGVDLAPLLARSNGMPSYEVIPPRRPIIVPTRRVLDSLAEGGA